MPQKIIGLAHNIKELKSAMQKAILLSQKLILGLHEWVDFDHPEGEAFLQMVSKGWFGGVILFRENCHAPQQVFQLTKALQNAASGRPFWISIDQEGGLVSRLDASFTPQIPMAKEIAMTQHIGTCSFFRQQAKDLISLGINLNFSPVVDLLQGSPVIEKKGRAFSVDAANVISWGKKVIHDFLQEGLTPCLKHFPGHGHISIDTHEKFAFYPFPDKNKQSKQALESFLDLHLAYPDVPVMVAHLTADHLSDGLPATLSPEWEPFFKEYLPADPILISDDVSMGAMNHIGTPQDILKLALQGPMSLIIFSQNPLANPLAEKKPIPFCDFPALLSQID